MMKSLAKCLAIVVLGVCLVACGSKLTQENFNKITNGMAYADVVKLLGEPTSSGGGGAFGITAGSTVWKDDKHQIAILFINEKVTSKTFSEVKPAGTQQ